MISIDTIKELRDKTGVSVMQCRQALEAAGGNTEKALAVLLKESARIASKKGERSLGAGVIGSYIHHGNTIGALVELNCETDFVAKNPEFKELASDLAMQVAAMSPETVSTEGASSPETALLNQSFVKDPSKTITDVVTSAIQKFGENIEIARFSRFSVLDR